MKKIFFILALYNLPLWVAAQSETPEFIDQKLDEYMAEALDKWEIPGVSVFIVKDNKVVVSKGYGVTKVGSKKKVNDQTIFGIGSNTKAFTGMALALLEEQGKCDLNDPVIKWLPTKFTMKDSWVQNNATLTDIVTHRLGMETFQGDFMWWGADMMEGQMFKKFGMIEPNYAFRTKWGYCNMGYVIAGACIKKISDRPWHGYLTTNFFMPLGMDRTYGYFSDLKNVSNIALAHTIIDNKVVQIPFGQIDHLGPAASIQSSASDMGRWVSMLLNKGVYNEKTIIPESVIKRAWEPQSMRGRGGHPFNKSHYSLYGLGWNLSDYEGSEIVSHTGGIDGYVTSVTLLPEQNLGIVVLTNTDQNLLFEALKWEIIDAYLKLPFRDYSNLYYNYWKRNHDKEETAIAAKRDSISDNPEMGLDLEAYVGTYVHEVYGTIEVSKKGKALLLTFEHHPDLTATLEGLGGNRFLCTYSNILYGIKVFPFKVEEGNAKSFTLSVSDFLEFTTYEFVKM